jgi:hypothetical protein
MARHKFHNLPHSSILSWTRAVGHFGPWNLITWDLLDDNHTNWYITPPWWAHQRGSVVIRVWDAVEMRSKAKGGESTPRQTIFCRSNSKFGMAFPFQIVWIYNGKKEMQAKKKGGGSELPSTHSWSSKWSKPSRKDSQVVVVVVVLVVGVLLLLSRSTTPKIASTTEIAF